MKISIVGEQGYCKNKQCKAHKYTRYNNIYIETKGAGIYERNTKHEAEL